MPDLVGQFDEMIKRSPDARSSRPEIKHKAIIGHFFTALKEVRANKKKLCVDDRNAKLSNHTSW